MSGYILHVLHSWLIPTWLSPHQWLFYILRRVLVGSSPRTTVHCWLLWRGPGLWGERQLKLSLRHFQTSTPHCHLPENKTIILNYCNKQSSTNSYKAIKYHWRYLSNLLLPLLYWQCIILPFFQAFSSIIIIQGASLFKFKRERSVLSTNILIYIP